MGSRRTCLEDLDDACLTRVFGFLSPLPDLFAVARTCKANPCPRHLAGLAPSVERLSRACAAEVQPAAPGRADGRPGGRQGVRGLGAQDARQHQRQAVQIAARHADGCGRCQQVRGLTWLTWCMPLPQNPLGGLPLGPR